MKKLAFYLAVVGLILTGCIVTSVHPFYTQKDVVSGKTLMGKWKDTKESKDYWVFEPGSQDSLKLTIISGEETNLISAHLFTIDQSLFLDLFPLKPDASGCPPGIPSHMLLRVDQMQPTLKIAALNHDWLLKLVQQHPGNISHLIVKDPDKSENQRVVLTAETAKLQRFVHKQMKNPEAWQDASELQRE
jgi:hypothetical protein